ncbi:protein kinase [Micromonospora sp. NPDC000089]|uniref:serine/threonine-protein kinase n=1 Tax=unclassified Micromonospora TaxID=2617518 RepID=UPI0036AC45F0
MRLLSGRYRLVEPVGQGGMAVVWRAEDELLHRTVAVKLLAPQLATDARSRALIRAEAQAAARLNHPHIAGVYDYGEARPRGYRRVPYLVMEFVPGDTLAARLHAAGALPWPQAVRVCADVAGALSAAHAGGLVHRDVKPANVLLSPTGVKLVDLGVALAVGQRSADERGQVLGTPRYMAPEQVSGDPAVPASDVYALGLLLHECLTGKPLRRGATLAELLAQDHAANAAEEPDVAGLPESVRRLRRRCLAPEALDRPTAAEAAALLAEVAGVRPSTVVTPLAAASPADPAHTTRLAAPPRRPARAVPAPAGRPARPRRGVPRAVLLTAAPAVALAAVFAGQLPGLTSTDDAAEGAAAGPAAGCTARYTANRAPDGTFTADLTVTRTGPRSSDAWALSFGLPAGQRVTGGSDNARLTQRADRVTVDLGAPPAAGTATVTLRGTYRSADRGGPTDFALDGLPCGQAATSITSTTAAQPSEVTGAPAGGADGGGAGAPVSGGARATHGPRAGDPVGPAANPKPTATDGPAPTPPGAPTASATAVPGSTTAVPRPAPTSAEPSPTESTAAPQTPAPTESTEAGGEPTPTESAAAEPSATS